ncbi:hypothetical protein C2G38_2198699 [Gigaspora rosea]|uniref:Uncharacterized protein n=1 Tax=Gigaspora rosea TaxID=44941 RepID=A0A397USB8_9GLOM|nr:hypothetical protein C2G38_2198699 [Gigaspora rosea]
MYYEFDYISEISFLKSTVESLINEVNKLKSDKATTSNDPSEYVDVDDTETTSVMGTTGLSCPMDNIVNPSNKKGKQREDRNIPANDLRIPSVTLEPPSRYTKKSREYLEEMTADQYKLFHDEVIQILNGLDDSLQLDPTKT